MTAQFTDEQKSKLERIATAMMLATDILDAAGVPAGDADRHLAEGHVAIMKLLYPNGVPTEEIDKHCKCGQPLDHGIIN
jgi:hypothetical protein